ncbi:aminotransferase class I/II-fold pyridoxal phosphate-dependent enzyme [Actinokineospora globicatena]|uniref:aminotransferase class I/II-fold pyridoxal phosphate-dependent enzyme n=1 Tax=Actinokineospora globicatena TaxID=103729 RepID=UPI0020A533AA|nr:aminotransferase class I/II-fold pyridoxal phosphate-dependent enzyme [Actinokineospora globicatena]MCP2303929.1 L-threonine O-3-phosphate decarboxylase [Actinokineospora globicatena]GLW78911.1 hypothetical protein Aglo01_33930 [Actinokineospora globicatena]GLW86677.1 hypothetical protein Aglo02_43160 [Actinokineospora globicatena]
MALANSSYRSLPLLGDDEHTLNLAWTLDERELLDVDIPALLRAELTAEATTLAATDTYLVKDPHGSAALGPVVSALFDRHDWACGVVCAAGVNSLLQAVAALAPGGNTYVVGEVYPDLPHWVRRLGGELVTADDHLRGVRESRPRLVSLDRPSATGTAFDDLHDLRELCAEAARHGAVVVVDESYANYRPLGFSAVTIADQVDNLVVFRGLSKGYWLGGIRLAYCVSSPALTGVVTGFVPPMLASSISLRLGAAVLRLGDVTTRLRARIAEVAPQVVALAERAGLPAPLRGGSGMPHLHFAEDLGKDLGTVGILGKSQPFWSARDGGPVDRYRLSLPLRPARLAELERRLVGRPADTVAST